MQDQSGESPFDMRLTHEGMAALQHNARLVRPLFIVGMIGAVLLFVENLLGIIRYQMLHYKANGLSGFFYTKLHPVLSVIDAALIIFQIYAFFRFGRISGKAIDEKDEVQLNRSFVYLVRSIRLAIIQIWLVVAIYLITIFILIESLPSSAG